METATRLVCAALLGGSAAFAQPTGDSPLSSPPNGPRDARTTWHAITGATVHISPEEAIEDASVLIRDGRIWQVESGVRADRLDLTGYRVWEGEGLHVYAGFIDAFVEVDAPGVDQDAPGAHWNEKVTPQRRATDGDGAPESTASGRRKLGFAAGNITPSGGIFRGTSAVVSFAERNGDTSVERPPVYAQDAANVLTLASGGWGGGYPTSRVGTIALIRQTLSDAEWQLHERRIGAQLATNAIDALESTERPLLFDVDNELEVLRAAAIADEFQRPAIIVGSGTSYRRLDAIADAGRPLIAPLRFTEEPDVSSIGAADAVELGALMAWEQDPTNLRRLHDAGVTTAITASKLGRRENFHENLRKAIAHGLDESAALAMLTTVPAELLGVETILGTVEKDKLANLVVTDGPMFEKKTKIRDVWVDGRRHEINAAPGLDPSGTWAFEFDGAPGQQAGTLVIRKTGNRISVTLKGEEGEKDVKARNVKLEGNRLSYLGDVPGQEATVIVTAVIEGDEMTGTILAGSQRMTWTGTKQPSADPEGAWRATELHGQIVDPVDPDAPKVVVKGDKVTVTLHGTEVEATDVTIEGGEVAFTFDGAKVGMEGPVTMTGTVAGDEMKLVARTPAGGEQHSTLARQDEEKPDAEEETYADVPERLGYPFGPYMVESIPPQQDVVIKNATIWTCGPQGVIEKGWISFNDGKIIGVQAGEFEAEVGDGVVVIDAAGKHVTPGLIDCHSHTGTWSAGTNEGGQAVTSEVRMADTTDPDPVNWYRQLAGGTTTVNTLHGSANPIGGQNVVQKVRWGAVHPKDMHFEGAKPGIKFALGENVKRTRSRDSTRYPRTRMGVETLIRDRFEAARDYAESWSDWRAQVAEATARPGGPILPAGGVAEVVRTGIPNRPTLNTGSELPRPRRDLELEALAEILAGERLIHCHSYRQDEILMLCRVAEDFGFTIGTFQHVLEGYKVAEAIKEHALGGSSFSDWWAYKIEVQDAIPHNGAIMHDVGVVVSFNSDSDELARRMNTEAAKAVRYGGVEPAEALKFVTINAAKQLMIDDRVGSLESGKDADVVIWSGDPLSTLSRAEYVAIDGREYFSLERDRALRAQIDGERNRLIQKILAKGRKGDGKDKKDDNEGDAAPERPEDPFETMYRNAIREYALDLYLSGQDPNMMFSDGCGVSLLEYLEGTRYRMLQGLDRSLGTHNHNHNR